MPRTGERPCSAGSTYAAIKFRKDYHHYRFELEKDRLSLGIRYDRRLGDGAVKDCLQEEGSKREQQHLLISKKDQALKTASLVPDQVRLVKLRCREDLAAAALFIS